MNKTLLTSALTTTLIACGGGGGGGGSSTQTGSVDGLSGVAYSTASQSGVLNSDGNFSYEPGETLTLSLGGITLGSAAADANMKVTDFLGNLPKTAAEFRFEMRRKDQGREIHQTSYPERKFANTINSDLHKAVNIFGLLTALDDDNNPDNGLELSTGDWHNTLSAITDADIALQYHMLDFPAQLGSGLSQNIYLERVQQLHGFSVTANTMDVASRLYKLAGISLTAYPITSITQSGINPDSITYTFDALYQVSKIVTKEFIDGNPSSIDTDNYTWNEKGLKTQKESLDDTNADGTLNYRRVEDFTYNNFNQPLSKRVQEFDNGPDNAVTSDRQTDYQYLNDRMLQTFSRNKSNLNAESNHDVIIRDYDDQGRITRYTSESRDQPSDTTAGTQEVTTTSYNDAGEIDSKTKTNGGGTTTYSFTYNANVITQKTVTGGTKSELEEKFSDTKRAKGILSKSKKTYNVENDALIKAATTTYTIDTNNGITGCFNTIDNDADGTIDETQTVKSRYGKHGHIGASIKIDENGDGSNDKEGSFTSQTYGDDGRILTSEAELQTWSYSDTAATDGARYLVTAYTIERNYFNQSTYKCSLLD